MQSFFKVLNHYFRLIRFCKVVFSIAQAMCVALHHTADCVQNACICCRFLQTFSSEPETVCMCRKPVMCHWQNAAQTMSILPVSEVP